MAKARLRVLARPGGNWRLLCGAVIAAAAVYGAIELSDYSGSLRHSGRLCRAHDVRARSGIRPLERRVRSRRRRYRPHRQAVVHRALPRLRHRASPADPLARKHAGSFAQTACDPAFDQDAALKGTRYRLDSAARAFRRGLHAGAYRRPSWQEIDARDRALLAIEREGLSHEALVAGALANLTEPVVIFAGAVIAAALLIL